MGLVTRECLAEAEHQVVCTNIDREGIAKLNARGADLRTSSRPDSPFRPQSRANLLRADVYAGSLSAFEVDRSRCGSFFFD